MILEHFSPRLTWSPVIIKAFLMPSQVTFKSQAFSLRIPQRRNVRKESQADNKKTTPQLASIYWITLHSSCWQPNELVPHFPGFLVKVAHASCVGLIWLSGCMRKDPQTQVCSSVVDRSVAAALIQVPWAQELQNTDISNQRSQVAVKGANVFRHIKKRVACFSQVTEAEIERSMKVFTWFKSPFGRWPSPSKNHRVTRKRQVTCPRNARAAASLCFLNYLAQFQPRTKSILPWIVSLGCLCA
jgi:hypothetical protein